MRFTIIDLGEHAHLYIDNTLVSRYEYYYKIYRKIKTVIKWNKNATKG